MSDFDRLYIFFSAVRDTVMDKALTAEQRRDRLRDFLAHLADMMGSTTAAHLIWLRLMEAIDQQRTITRH